MFAGAGYHFDIAKKPRCDIDALTAFITEDIPSAKKERSSKREVTYLLPTENKPQFAALFEKLEASRKTLKIESFGMSLTTMEEVFIK